MEGHQVTSIGIIYGADRIARFLGIGRRQVYHAGSRHGLPVFKIGTTICARPEPLLAWVAAQEALAEQDRIHARAASDTTLPEVAAPSRPPVVGLALTTFHKRRSRT